ncbi:hypothetical protein DAMA08_002770 [Martiniozyma asiatica (nom. inval.)]|nr:hypothetical protein DAMA08_002770 [Martiniozyma asiatica]
MVSEEEEKCNSLGNSDLKGNFKSLNRACDQCRARKIKCNGLSVCNQCTQRSMECTYLYVPKKAASKKVVKKRGRPKKTNSLVNDLVSLSSLSPSTHSPANKVTKPEVNNVENRLERMESMMTTLMNNINLQKNESSLLLNINNDEFKSSLSTTDSSSANSLDYNNIETEEEIDKSIVNSGTIVLPSMFLLSEQGRKLTENSLKDPSLIIPLKSVIEFASPLEKNLLSVWVEPIEKCELSPLPSRELIECFLFHFKKVHFFADFVCIKTVQNLFKMYCDYRDHLIPRPKFKYSDFLLMNSVLLFSCCALIELNSMEVKDCGKLPEVNELKYLEQKLLDNAIFYFHRVSVISNGLSSVSGCAILAVYADGASLSRAALLIASTGIRHAQQMGLHREESYRGLSAYERSTRLRIWWSCYSLDKSMCFRWGHAPIIDDSEISAPPLPGFEKFWSFNQQYKKNEPKTREKKKFQIQELLDNVLSEEPAHHGLLTFINIDFSIILSEIYKKLLGANALKGKTREQILQTQEELLHDLECWKNNLPRWLQPQNELSDEYIKRIDEMKHAGLFLTIHKVVLITAHNVYYHHLRMIINTTVACRMFSEFPEKRVNELVIESRLEDARSILRMTCLVDGWFVSYANFFIFYPFDAFVLLCAHYIQASSTTSTKYAKKDIMLMIKVINKYFEPFSLDCKRSEKGWLIGSVVKCVLYLTIYSLRENGKEINLPTDIQRVLESIFKPIFDFQNGKIPIDELVLTPANKIKLMSIKRRDFVDLPIDFSPFKTPVVRSNYPRVHNTVEKNNEAFPLPSISSLLQPNDLSTNAADDWTEENEQLFHNLLQVPNYMVDGWLDGLNI